MRKRVLVTGWRLDATAPAVVHDFLVFRGELSARCVLAGLIYPVGVGGVGRPWTNADLGHARFCAYCMHAIRAEIGLTSG